MKSFILGMMVILLAACGGVSSREQTLEAQVGTQAIEVAAIAASATVDADRLRATLDTAETLLARERIQRQNMVSTLQERGIAVQSAPGEVVQAAPPTETPFGLAAQPTPFPNQQPQITPQAQQQVTTPTATVGGIGSPLGLSNIVTAPDVGDDDCALNPTNQFTPNTEAIYVVALATNLADGTTVTTRWSSGGQVLATFDFTYGFIQQACIWFFADQTDFEFVPGDYTINIQVNGTIAGQVNFTIVDDMG